MSGIPYFPPIEAKVDGHALKLSIGGKDRLAALLAIIESAKTSLRLCFYIFADDETARLVKAALVAARNRGVNVWLLVDGFGTAGTPDAAFQPLVEAGIGVSRFNARWGRGYLLRNHQKIVIADEARALVGGSNVSDSYFQDDPEGASWHDLFLEVDGPAAARLACYFDGMRRWVEAERPTLRRLLHLLARRSEAKGSLRWLFNGPFSRLSPLTRAIRQDIAGSRRLDMIQAYFSPNWGTLRRLAALERRGGKVRIVSAAMSDNLTTVSAARHCYRRLLLSRIQIYEYLPQMLHMKLIVADDIVYVGSANFDMRSLYLNGEIMLRIEDASFAASVRELFDAHLPHCKAITREGHRASSNWLTRMRWLIAYFIVSTVDFTVTRNVSLRRR